MFTLAISNALRYDGSNTRNPREVLCLLKKANNLESRQRGSSDFPIEYHSLDSRHPRYEMPYHWHEEQELVYVSKGSFDLTLEDETCHLSSGDAMFINSEQLHGGLPHDCCYECLVFDMRMLMKCGEQCKKLIGRIILHELYPVPLYPDGSECAARIREIFHILRDRKTGWELSLLGALYAFFGIIYRNEMFLVNPSPSPEGKRILQLKPVFEAIETGYASNLLLDDLSQTAHMTPKYFCRFFKEAVHRTPIDYLNFYRIEQACDEIAVSEKSLTEIALDTGFSDLNYFIRVFKKYKCMTPGRYMQLVRK